MQYGNRDRERGDWRRSEREGNYPASQSWRGREGAWERPSEYESQSGYRSSRSDWDEDRSRSESQRGGWGGYEDQGGWNREDQGWGGGRRGESSYSDSRGYESRGSSRREPDSSNYGGRREDYGRSRRSGGGFGLDQASDRYGSGWMGSWGGDDWDADTTGGTNSGFAVGGSGSFGRAHRSEGSTRSNEGRNRGGMSWGGGYEGDDRSRGGQSDWQRGSSQIGSSQFARDDHRGKGPKGYKRSDDRIKEDVSEALKNDRDVDASNIEVEVQEGTVTLRGEVQSRREKRAAEDCCEDVPGVTDVTNQLRVQSKGKESEGDGSERSTNVPYNRAGTSTSSSNSGQGQSSSKSQRIGTSNNS